MSFSAMRGDSERVRVLVFLLILILALMSRAAVASPVNAPGSVQSDNAHCIPRARELLATLRHVLEKERIGPNTLFHGFNCTDLPVVVNRNTQTAIVCQPTQDVKCSDHKTSPFSETECLQNIANDLDYHRSMLTKYVSTLDQKANSESVKELNTITDSIHNLQQTWSPINSFEDRKDLCKQLKGFRVRTITINRALGYVCAGEYKN
ncbi:hypothetical protein Baya_10874 [Bagarius yarrelli]|uniref:Interleukin-12 subunit alpha n=1 Tax=Bagarius yarrelli TaxID=175774 RepID=A0A556UYA4_BAGYA|nr:hypothetical protein Baya_10874 [Bagarius yarrelli]